MTAFMRRHHHHGFTLVELLMAVVILGVLSILFFPTAKLAGTVRDLTANERQRMINGKIATALVAHASKNTTLGTLPAPYSSGQIKLGPVDPASATLVGEVVAAGVDPREMNDDAYASQHVRVFQRVTGLTQTTPLYFQSGPLVTLTYQYGVVYQTACERAAACNGTVPGASGAMTSGNYSTWNITGTDSGAAFVSTLPLQKQMLETTVKRIERVRDALISNFTARALLAVPSDTTNWNPSGSTSLAGGNPGTNQGCRDGWYDLASTNVLTQIGLAASEFGVTAWGGAIEYCRKYDPTGGIGAAGVPHYAALRILADVSSGGNPDSATPSNNLLISM